MKAQVKQVLAQFDHFVDSHHGIYSEQLTAAIEMLIESKKPREELINLDELEEGIGGDGL